MYKISAIIEIILFQKTLYQPMSRPNPIKIKRKVYVTPHASRQMTYNKGEDNLNNNDVNFKSWGSGRWYAIIHLFLQKKKMLKKKDETNKEVRRWHAWQLEKILHHCLLTEGTTPRISRWQDHFIEEALQSRSEKKKCMSLSSFIYTKHDHLLKESSFELIIFLEARMKWKTSL